MSATYSEIGPTCRPLNARIPAGEECISLVTKRTYVMNGATGKADPADDQLPLRSMPVFVGDDPNKLLIADTEGWPYKLRTDVVVQGHVYGNGARRVDAAVVVGGARRDLTVSGDRQCSRTTGGRIVFSEPEPFDKMPLGYDRAYGGYDAGSEAAHPNLFELIGPSLPAGTDPKIYSLCGYPRNRHGRGYYLSSSTTPIDEVQLPNIEAPEDLLVPERLVVADPLAWWRQPVPAGVSWLHGSYIARCVYMGVKPFWQPLPDDLPEFERGYLSREARGIDVTREDPAVFGVQSGGSLGLQLSHVGEGSVIRLVGMHPERQTADVEVPAPPTITVETRWRGAEIAPPALHHVELYPDDGVFSVVWRGAVAARRTLLPEELDALAFKVEWIS